MEVLVASAVVFKKNIWANNKKELFSLKSKLRQIQVELDSLRNQNLDDDLEIGDIIGIKLETKKRSNKASILKSIVKEEYLENYKDINIIKF